MYSAMFLKYSCTLVCMCLCVNYVCILGSTRGRGTKDDIEIVLTGVSGRSMDFVVCIPRTTRFFEGPCGDLHKSRDGRTAVQRLIPGGSAVIT